MNIDQVAAQFYTVRDFTQTAADLAQSFRKVRQIGYCAVQLSAIGPIPESDIVKMLDGEGLICCATHEPPDLILNAPDVVIDRLKKLNCPYTAYPYPAGINFTDAAAVDDFLIRLDAAGAKLHAAGITLTYHNHALEFQRLQGQLLLELIYNRTTPQTLQGEIDTYWVQYGGGDPVAWCRKLQNRLPLLHLKDYLIVDNSPVFSEIGFGNLDWPAIIRAAEASGCRWFIVEQDICPADPFDSLQKSFDYIRENLCR